MSQSQCLLWCKLISIHYFHILEFIVSWTFLKYFDSFCSRDFSYYFWVTSTWNKYASRFAQCSSISIQHQVHKDTKYDTWYFNNLMVNVVWIKNAITIYRCFWKQTQSMVFVTILKQVSKIFSTWCYVTQHLLGLMMYYMIISILSVLFL